MSHFLPNMSFLDLPVYVKTQATDRFIEVLYGPYLFPTHPKRYSKHTALVKGIFFAFKSSTFCFFG